MSILESHRLRSERGATLPLVAISLVALLAMVAVVVDLGMLYAARAEAQRAADAAALAGASALIDFAPADQQAQAVARGTDWAGRNQILQQRIGGQDQVTIMYAAGTGDTTVRAHILRPAVALFFGGIFGRQWGSVAGHAAARAFPTGTANCLKPFGSPMPSPAYTESDYGQEIEIYSVKDTSAVLLGFDGSPPGLGEIRTEIASQCPSNASFRVGEPVTWAKPENNANGQVRLGVGDMLSHPDIWSPNSSDPGCKYTTPYGCFTTEDWRESPRVGTIALYTKTMAASGTYQVTVQDFVTVYFSREAGQAANPSNPYTVYGRIFPALGIADDCAGGTCGPNTFVLRLVD